MENISDETKYDRSKYPTVHLASAPGLLQFLLGYRRNLSETEPDRVPSRDIETNCLMKACQVALGVCDGGGTPGCMESYSGGCFSTRYSTGAAIAPNTVHGRRGICKTRIAISMLFPHSSATFADTVTCLALNPKGTHLLSNSMDSTLRSWDVRPFVDDGAGGKKLHDKTFVRGTHNAEKGLLNCAWSADGTMATGGSADRVVRVWDEPSSEEVRFVFMLCSFGDLNGGKLTLFVPFIASR